MRKNLSAETEETKPDKGPVHLRLLEPINGLVAGRVVTASGAKASELTKSSKAAKATPKQVAIAGGNIPHLHD